jgi:signal transduction histidine kinase
MWTPPRRFASADEEAAFLLEYCQRFVSHRRVALLLGFLISSTYLAFDYLYSAGDPQFAPRLGAVLENRVVSTLLLLPVIATALRPRFAVDEVYASRWLVIFLTLEFGLYCRGFVLAPYPYDYMFYFMGMFICLIYGFSMLRLRSLPTMAVMTILVLMAAATFAWNWEVKHADLSSPVARIYAWVGLSFLASVAMMGVVVSTLLERSERETFERARELASSNQAVQERNHQMEQLNEALRLSGQEAQQRAQALIAIKEEMRLDAERRNREKSQFLAAAVHDLKQPIQAISNALEPGQYALDSNDQAGARRMFELAGAATRLMRDQLASVLEMSRLESGFVTAEIKNFDLDPVLDAAVSQLADLSQRHGVELQVATRGLTSRVESDRHFMQRIVLNLLSNGIKYSDAGKTSRWVRIATEAQAMHLRVEITDNGLGIEPALLNSQAIFKPFFQANNQHRESDKGVGLGLSIVQAMLALMPNHHLKLRSQVGVGTTITLDVPLACSELAGAELPPDPWDAADPPPQVRELAGCYVLYVEDDELVRASTSALFDAYGILYEAVESHAQLCRLLPRMERVPDMLLTDYRLPEGATAVQVVEATVEAFGELPVLVVTGETSKAGETGEEEARTHRWRLLRKPLSSVQLLMAIYEAIRSSEDKADSQA